MADNNEVSPEHIVAGLADAVIVGVMFTVTGTVTGVLGQSVALVPTTVYVIVDPGDTLTVEPVSPPGCHK